MGWALGQGLTGCATVLISPAEDTTGFLGQIRLLLPSSTTALGRDITMQNSKSSEATQRFPLLLG